MARVVLMCGPAGAGKSTWARALEAQGWRRLSIDEEAWRRGHTEHPLPAEVSDDIVRQQQHELVQELKAGRDVVVDYSFWSRARRDEYRALARRHGGSVEVVYLCVPREELVRRVDERNREPRTASTIRVDAHTLAGYIDGFEAPGVDEADVRVVQASG